MMAWRILVLKVLSCQHGENEFSDTHLLRDRKHPGGLLKSDWQSFEESMHALHLHIETDVTQKQKQLFNFIQILSQPPQL